MPAGGAAGEPYVSMLTGAAAGAPYESERFLLFVSHSNVERCLYDEHDACKMMREVMLTDQHWKRAEALRHTGARDKSFGTPGGWAHGIQTRWEEVFGIFILGRHIGSGHSCYLGT